MKFKIFSAVVIIALVIVACSFKKKPEANKSNESFEPVAVIELFTSQGCSSCPSADALLAQTIAGTKKDGRKIFALSFHVDYWNRLGWTDPFSNAAYSARQKNYVSALGLDGAYTPQMVVNGITEFIGSDKGALEKSLASALNTKAAINFNSLAADYGNNKTIKVQYAIDGDITGIKINFALISLSETTSVKRGENGGQTLTNENVVRQLVTKNAEASGAIEFANSSFPAKENMSVVAFVQQEKGLKIVGAAMAKIN